MAQLVARRLAGRQARVRFPARHHREVFPTEQQAMRKWRKASANVLYECDWMIVLYECYKNIKINKKEWHTATKPLKSEMFKYFLFMFMFQHQNQDPKFFENT